MKNKLITFLCLILPLVGLNIAKADEKIDKADQKWITGKTFAGMVNMLLPDTKEFRSKEEPFTGQYKNETPFKLEFRGTTLDKLNPFRKKSYWRLYLYEDSTEGAKAKPKLIDIHGDLEYKVENGALKLFLYNGDRKNDKRLTLTASIPVSEVKKSNKIVLTRGEKGASDLETKIGTRLQNLQDMDLVDTKKGMLKQLKQAMDRSGMTPVLQKALMTALGIAVTALL